VKLIGSLIVLGFILVLSPYLWGEAERRRSDEIDVPRLVESLRQMEGGSPDKEGGEWCVSLGVWKDRAPGWFYSDSRNPVKCREVASRQIKWLIEQLGANGIRPTVERIAHSWRYGLDSYLLTRKTGDYGRRCANLYESD